MCNVTRDVCYSLCVVCCFVFAVVWGLRMSSSLCGVVCLFVASCVGLSCSLFVVCCLFFSGCRLYWLVIDVCCSLSICCWLCVVVCCLLFVACCVLFVGCRLCVVACCLCVCFLVDWLVVELSLCVGCCFLFFSLHWECNTCLVSFLCVIGNVFVVLISVSYVTCCVVCCVLYVVCRLWFVA